jgi:hypothetical protein
MINVFTFSEPGGHANNEDAFEVRPVADGFLCAVADGQGGRAGGAAAAQLACKMSLGEASNYPLAELLQPATWPAIMRVADAAVCGDPAAGFTTLAAFFVGAGRVSGASSGDSAAVLINANKASEVLTARQHKNPPVGSGVADFVAFDASLVTPWTVLAMTDGVWKYAGLSRLIQIASEKSASEAIAAIREHASLNRSGRLQDDFTLVVLAGGDA